MYSVGRRTKRWPLCLFFNFLDVVAINSTVIYKAVKQDDGMARKDFIKQLALQLMRDALNMRNQAKNLSRDLQVLIQKHAGSSSLERNWSTDTEQYTLSEEENNEDPSFNYYIGKDQKTKWKKALPPKNVRTRSENIITHLPGEKNPEGPYNVSNSPSDVVERLLTIVGTLKRNKKEIPSEFVISRGRNVHTSVFGFQSEMTLLSYKPKENKVVLMLSTLHHDANIDDSTGELKKPEMIMFYNMTKGGVDVMGEMTATYNCARNSRWPMVNFYPLSNIGAINSQIIHFANGNASKVKSRRHFLKTLSLNLIEEMVKVCTVSGRMPCEIKEKASDIFNLLEPGPSKKPKIGERHRCKKCQKEKKDRKTIQHCQYCFAFLCKEHCNNLSRMS
ncbi:hypothetical protein LAZ67_6000002 [Cordylochernes scorpioides]|uniref:PiggyBac transposable element-derived protein domain-containing protein n=1 Tax=Cordylochernes scorpioides TaxID=51811 RepID=A0ABY6KI37_9ARAC|nr:hypothetical protein LAZ67_6000002 [Cordylochernes scorpioides]